MGCCCSASARAMLEIDLPTGEMIKVVAPATYKALEDFVLKKLPHTERVKIHHDAGTLTPDTYLQFLKNPSKLLVEALDVAPKRDSPPRVRTARWAGNETSRIDTGPLPYLVDVDKGAISVFRVNSGRAKVYRSDLVQWESRVAVMGEKLIVTGGKGNGRECLVVDIESGRMSKGAQMMEGRLSHAVAVLNDSLYAIGGYSNEEMKSCEVYSNYEWFPGGALNRCRSYHVAVTCQGWVFVCGGCKESTFEVLEDSGWRLLAAQLPMYLSRPAVSAYHEDSLLITGGEVLKGGTRSEYNQSAFVLDIQREEIAPAAALPEPACFTHAGTNKDAAALFFNVDSLFHYQSGKWTVTRLND